MIIKLGKEANAVTINMLQVCYWQPKESLRLEKPVYEIYFPCGSLVLSVEESQAFEQFLQQSSQPKLIQPVPSGLSIL